MLKNMPLAPLLLKTQEKDMTSWLSLLHHFSTPKKSPRTRSFWSLPSKPSPKPPHPVDACTTHLRTSNEPKNEIGVGSHRADLQLRYPCNLPHVKGSNICLFVFNSLGILLVLVWMRLWMLVSINTWKTWRTYTVIKNIQNTFCF